MNWLWRAVVYFPRHVTGRDRQAFSWRGRAWRNLKAAGGLESRGRGRREGVVARTYAELRRGAHGFRHRERQHHTLQSKALLTKPTFACCGKGREPPTRATPSFGSWLPEMRCRLIDRARRRLTTKRGGGIVHEPISTSAGIPARQQPDDIEALARLDKARVELSSTFRVPHTSSSSGASLE